MAEEALRLKDVEHLPEVRPGQMHSPVEIAELDFHIIAGGERAEAGEDRLVYVAGRF